MVRTIECGTKGKWLEERRNYIGASDAAAILGVAPEGWASGYSIAQGKLRTGPVEQDEETEAMRWGHYLEEPMRLEVARDLGGVHNPGDFTIQVSDDYPFMACTLDGILPDAERANEFFGDGARRNGPGILQIKTTSNLDAWKQNGQMRVPIYYEVQEQHELAVMDYKWCVIAVLFIEDRQWKREMFSVLPQAKFRESLITAESKFWFDLRDGIMPEVDASPATAKALLEAYPSHTPEEVIRLPADAITATEELDELKDKRKQIDEQIALRENRLKHWIGSAEGGRLPDGSGWTWKLQHRKSYTVKESSARVLRRKNLFKLEG